MKHHNLKTWPEHFDAVAAGLKTFEARRDDRGFEVGDTLTLRRFDPQIDCYTGSQIDATIMHLLRGGQFGIEAGTVILSLRLGGANHADDLAVDAFAVVMKAKLALKRAQGYDGWDNPEICSVEFLSRLLVEHLPKGDPVDIGNFAMMLFARKAPKEVIDLAANATLNVERARADSAEKELGDALHYGNQMALRSTVLEAQNDASIAQHARDVCEITELRANYAELLETCAPMKARAEAAEADLMSLRELFPRIAAACGGSASHRASIEFLRDVPLEVEALAQRSARAETRVTELEAAARWLLTFGLDLVKEYDLEFMAQKDFQPPHAQILTALLAPPEVADAS